PPCGRPCDGPSPAGKTIPRIRMVLYGTAMPDTQGSPRSPVTADDVQLVVRLALAALREPEKPDWRAQAGSLAGDLSVTVEHVADAILGYAAQLCPANPPMDTHVAFALHREMPGGPANALF